MLPELLLQRGTTMAFPEDVVEQAWKRAGGKCECKRREHKHVPVRCGKDLVYTNRGREGQGRWEAHCVNPKFTDILYNCEILCADCYKLSLYGQ